ncbi:MAG: hypothetical protein ACT4N5_07675 [Nitrosopumilaceae archaeon]
MKLLLLFCFFLLATGSFSAQGEILVSAWIKETARLWSEEKIDDSRFIQSIQYLIKNRVIQTNFTEDSEQVYFLPKYGQESLVSISGTTGDFKKTGYVFLAIVRPDEEIIDSRASVLESGIYQTIMILGHDFPTGEYKVTGTYKDAKIPTSYFYVRESTDTKIPFWIKNNAKWWADDKISDNDFVLGLQYLINKKIFQIDYNSEKISKELHISVGGMSAVRRGTVQSIEVMVTNEHGPVKDVIVLVRVEDYGENVLKDFDGNTDSNGKYVISWEIDKNAEAETLLAFIDVTDGFSSASSVYQFAVTCYCGDKDCECR